MKELINHGYFRPLKTVGTCSGGYRPVVREGVDGMFDHI
jgi:hypothetical protein